MRATYEITSEKKIEDHTLLHRIKALPGNKFAKPGALGGWIEKEDNLFDGAWVTDKACVYGDAKVYGNTLIEDSAQIYGNAKIHGESEELLTISWDLKIHGGDWTDTPYYRVGGLWMINISSPDTVRIGCRDYTFEKWKKSYKAILYAYRREQIDEIGVKECVEVYNAICRKYLKYEYMVDPAEILDCYKKVKATSLLPLQRT